MATESLQISMSMCAIDLDQTFGNPAFSAADLCPLVFIADFFRLGPRKNNFRFWRECRWVRCEARREHHSLPPQHTLEGGSKFPSFPLEFPLHRSLLERTVVTARSDSITQGLVGKRFLTILSASLEW